MGSGSFQLALELSRGASVVGLAGSGVISGGSEMHLELKKKKILVRLLADPGESRDSFLLVLKF